MQSGHYKTIAKAPCGKWDELEDEKVKRVPVNAALDPGNLIRKEKTTSTTWTPYLLFWARIDGEITAQTDPAGQVVEPRHQKDYTVNNTNGNHRPSEKRRKR